MTMAMIDHLPMNLHRFEIEVEPGSGETGYQDESQSKNVLLQVLGDDSIHDFRKLVEVGSNIDLLKLGAAVNFAEMSRNPISLQ
ncbi:unnamed protein product [Ambrosiozyma monospora]|uniref:Unnamed protein product n=1 Tax=Ambrosiozyma monospora TaxID=43982 RepID=A0A9W6Z308_AMBMO|nr:unnamed protein product [Ambrosiozyma monospora]